MGAETTNDETEKRVGFEKEEDAHSSGSDDDYQKAVEVCEFEGVMSNSKPHIKTLIGHF